MIPQLLGATPQLDGRFRYENGGITVSHARIDGAQSARRRNGPHRPRRRADLSVEATARGPLSPRRRGDRWRGRRDRPPHRPHRAANTHGARNAHQLHRRRRVVDQPIVDFTLAPRRTRLCGSRTCTRRGYRARPSHAAADVAIPARRWRLSNLDAHVGAPRSARLGHLRAAWRHRRTRRSTARSTDWRPA